MWPVSEVMGSLIGLSPYLWGSALTLGSVRTELLDTWIGFGKLMWKNDTFGVRGDVKEDTTGSHWVLISTVLDIQTSINIKIISYK